MQSGCVAPFLTPAEGVSETGIFPDTPSAGTRALAKSLAGMVEVAYALAKAGRRLDLTGLDTQVGLLCAKALDLPLEEGREFRQELIDLRSGLASLGEMIGLPPPG